MPTEATKKVVFYDTDKRHADLKIRLHYDGLTQAGFFRSMITGYLEVGDETKKKFSLLEDDEVESIFDMIEKEFPEL